LAGRVTACPERSRMGARRFVKFSPACPGPSGPVLPLCVWIGRNFFVFLKRSRFFSFFRRNALHNVGRTLINATSPTSL
jgi:hypothetical protein